jgi:hypothetical protein
VERVITYVPNGEDELGEDEIKMAFRSGGRIYVRSIADSLRRSLCR